MLRLSPRSYFSDLVDAFSRSPENDGQSEVKAHRGYAKKVPRCEELKAEGQG